MFTDCSTVAQAATLMQRDDKSKDAYYAISYTSRIFAESDRRWPVIDMAQEQNNDPELRPIIDFYNNEAIPELQDPKETELLLANLDSYYLDGRGCLQWIRQRHPKGD
ncbi:unnamed protein product [Gongylonema pulchrum]|uniref:Terminase large subunit n=1 Tax=Gongylonema pulchrum TaxID=637853 RepID=A0A183D9T6_9BILA|nr:unnamed protein product [Gongylonema pulchrum]